MIIGSRLARLPSALFLLAAAAWIPSARADVLLLADGKIIEGEIADRGESYEVKSKYGTLTIKKSEVKKIVRNPAQAAAEAEILQKLARESYDEALKQSDAKERQRKLSAGLEVLEKALKTCMETREVFPGPAHAQLDTIATGLRGEIRRLREKMAAEPTTLPPLPAMVLQPPVPPGTSPPRAAPAPPARPSSPPAGEGLPPKSAIPAESAQKQAETLIRDIYKADYAKRTPSDMTALAQRLIQQGHETKDDPVARYVLYREARDLAIQAGDAALALRAVEAAAQAFAIAPFEAKLAALGHAETAAKTPEAARAAADQYLRLMDEAQAADQYDAATRAGTRAEVLSRSTRDAAFTARVRDSVKGIQDLQKEAAALSIHQKAIATNPDDANANAAVGRFLCLKKGDWEKGLPMLAKGSDATLKTLAGMELAKTKDTADLLALADAWWDAGEKLTGSAKTAYLERSVYWYSAAAPKATGLSQAKISTRMAAFEKLCPQRTSAPGLPPLQGFGTSTRGGAGQEVVRVKTLSDHGPGSLRDALLKGNRAIVFDVAGEISLATPLIIHGAFITIDGLSAPSPGITLKAHGLDIRTESAHDIVVRGLRFRDGSGIAVWRGAHAVVIDHVSVHKPVGDGLLIARDVHDVTVSWSIFGDSEGRSLASVSDSLNVTLHHNLFVRSTRTIVSVGGSHEAPAESKTPKPRPASPPFHLDFRNNIVWGWAADRGTGIQLSGGAVANVVSNLFGAGGGLKDAAATVYNTRVSTVKVFAAGNISADPTAKDPNAFSSEKAVLPASPVTTTDAHAAAREILAGAGLRPLDAADREMLRAILLPARR
jgi:hypothetical protein